MLAELPYFKLFRFATMGTCWALTPNDRQTFSRIAQKMKEEVDREDRLGSESLADSAEIASFVERYRIF